MTPTQKVADLVRVLVPHFPVRFVKSNGGHDASQEIEWLKSLVDAVGSFDADILAEAAQSIINTRTDRRFPLPADIRRACTTIIEERRARSRAQALPIDRRTAPFGEFRFRLADELIDGDLGRQAAREGWVLGLHDFIRREMRLPRENYEVADIKKGTEGFVEAYTNVIRTLGSTRDIKVIEAMAPCKLIGDAMIARRVELERRLLGRAQGD